VEPANEAAREQLDRRLARTGQKAKEVICTYVHDATRFWTMTSELEKFPTSMKNAVKQMYDQLK
jgi:hypothetical protein